MESQTAMISMMRDILIATKASAATNVVQTHQYMPQQIIQTQPHIQEVKPVFTPAPQPKAPEVKQEPKPAFTPAPQPKDFGGKNTYKNELNQIKTALMDNKKASDLDDLVLLNSFNDAPVSLDDIDDDFSFITKEAFENKPAANKTNNNTNNSNVDDDFSFITKEAFENKPAQTTINNINDSNDDDWEWEYVDGDEGSSDDEEWEWEYVDDNESDDWEWEYVDDDDIGNK